MDTRPADAVAPGVAEARERVFAAIEAKLGRPLGETERVVDVVGNSLALERAKDALQAEIEKELRRVALAAARGTPSRIRVTDRMIRLLNALYEAGAQAAANEMRALGVEPRRDYADLNPRLGDIEGRLRAMLGGLSIRVEEDAVSATIGETSRAAIARSVMQIPGARGIAADLVSPAFARGLGSTYEQNRELFPGWIYSAMMDGATCDVCRALDGTEYDSWEAIQVVLPNGGPNPSCRGGSRCRCRAVPQAPDSIPPGRETPGPGGTPPPTDEIQLLTDPDEGADAFIAGLRETERRRGVVPDEAEIAKARKAWRKRIDEAAAKTPDPADVARIRAADEFNRGSDLHAAALNAHGRDRVLIVRDGATDPLLAGFGDLSAGQRLSGVRVTVVRREAIDVERTGPMRPGETSSISSGGFEALLRHEYGHQIWDDLDVADRDAFRTLWPKDSDTLRAQTTRYATTKDEETFCELFAIVADPDFDPREWAPWVVEFRAMLRARYGLDPDPPVYPATPVGQIMRARDEFDGLSGTDLANLRLGTGDLVAANGYPSRAFLDREEALRTIGTRVATEVDDRVVRAGVTRERFEADVEREYGRFQQASEKAWKAQEDAEAAILARHFGGRTLNDLTDREYDEFGLLRDRDSAVEKAIAARERARAKLRKAEDRLRRFEEEAVVARRRAIAEILEEIRGPGGVGGTFDLVSTSGAMQTLSKKIAALFPRSWIEASNGYRAGLRVRKSAKGRGFYLHGDADRRAGFFGSTIQVSGRKGIVGSDPEGYAVGIHEFGHRFEYVIPEIRAWEWAFHSRRTALSPVEGHRQGGSLRDLVPGSGYRSSEISYPDGFVDPYVGKVYGGGTPESSWEIFTIGLEGILTGSYRVWDLDPDHRDFILGILFAIG